jgi:hypothetical protein
LRAPVVAGDVRRLRGAELRSDSAAGRTIRDDIAARVEALRAELG